MLKIVFWKNHYWVATTTDCFEPIFGFLRSFWFEKYRSAPWNRIGMFSELSGRSEILLVRIAKLQYTKSEKWYFVTKIVLTFLRLLEQFIQTVKGQNNFWEQNAFLTCFMRFLISNKLEWLESKLEKKFWDRETCRKSEKIFDRDYFSDKINFILYPSVAKLKISTAQ